MIRPVRADQPEQTVLIGREAIKRQALKWSDQIESEKRCCSYGQAERKNMHFF